MGDNSFYYHKTINYKKKKREKIERHTKLNGRCWIGLILKKKKNERSIRLIMCDLEKKDKIVEGI